MESFRNAGSNLKNGVVQAGSGVRSVAGKGTKVVGSTFTDFKNFVDKGNVVDLAIGLVMGTAFTAVVTSIVKDLFTPIVGLAVGSNLENGYVYLKKPAVCISGESGNATAQALCSALNTPALAQNAGGVTWNYGNFIQTCINFLIISIILFFIIKAYSASFRRKKPAPKTKECPFCCKEIPLKATRCPDCTSPINDMKDLEGIIVGDKSF